MPTPPGWHAKRNSTPFTPTSRDEGQARREPSCRPRRAAAFPNHDITTLPEEDLGGPKDTIVSAAVTQEDRLRMTFDLDFGDVRKYPLGTHAGIVVFRLKDQRWRALETPAV
ncbi:MAG TPA: DUF5615 family PIN-like protein [Vicinamibacteria bacterium]|nr:DUF5615 family PIN-like protein [Vicinamibacteria bacterium]